MGRMNTPDTQERRSNETGGYTQPIDPINEDMTSGTEPHVEETQQVIVNSEPESEVPSVGSEKEVLSNSTAWKILLVLSLVALLAIALISAWGGYRSGIFQRTSFESTQVSGTLQEQFELALQDIAEKHYEVARQRLEYILQLNPGFPGITDKLAEVLVYLSITATPTQVSTPTLTPTIDLRDAQELFNQAQEQLINSEWSTAIDTLLRLRKKEPGYQAIKVDSMLYVAFRNRGVQRILKEADLEGGTYDLAVAERFGPLDVEAKNMRIWADLYVTGASFWELDWSQAAYYFGQIVMVAPNLRDKSNFTAIERFRIATIKYADLLTLNKEWCKASEQYQIALNLSPDPAVQPTASWVLTKCEGEETPEPEDTEEAPTPTPTPTFGDTPVPTDTPTPEPSPTPVDTPGYPPP